MKTAELIHQRVEDLPEAAHLALLEYLDFLLHKYKIDSPEASEATLLIQDLVIKRYEHYRQNITQRSQSLADFDSKIKKKYNWDE